MPISSKILRSLFGSADNLAPLKRSIPDSPKSFDSHKSISSTRATPEEEAAYAAQYVDEFVDDGEMVKGIAETRGFQPENVQYDVEANTLMGDADDATKFEVTPAELWQGYLGGDLFEPFRKRLLERNQPGDPNALFYNNGVMDIDEAFDKPVDVFISPGNQFDDSIAHGMFNPALDEVYMNAKHLDGVQDTFTHETGGHPFHKDALIAGDGQFVAVRDPDTGMVLADEWHPSPEHSLHDMRHNFSFDPNQRMADSYISHVESVGGDVDSQLAAIMSNPRELENFLFEIKQQGKLAYGEDFGVDKATNDRFIEKVLSDPVDTVEREALIGPRPGQRMQGFELNKYRFKTLWSFSSPEQKQVIRNALHRAGAVGGAAVLGGLTDDE